MAMYGQGVTRGRVAVLGIDAAVNQACAALLIKSKSLLPQFLFSILQTRYEDLRRISDARGGNQSNLSAKVLKEYEIPFPPIEIQKQVVAEFEREQETLAGLAELSAKYAAKIAARLAAVWGESESQPAQIAVAEISPQMEAAKKVMRRYPKALRQLAE